MKYPFFAVRQFSDFKKNFLIMSSGAFLNFLLVFILTPILSRIYSEAEFGIYYQYFSLATIISTFILGSYPVALVIPKIKDEYLKLLKLSLILTATGVVLFQISLFAAGDRFMQITNTTAIGKFIYLLPVSILLICVSTILNYSNIKDGLFKKNSMSLVAWSGSEKGIALTLGTLVNSIFPFLIVASIIGNLIRIMILASNRFLADATSLARINLRDTLKKGQEFIKYPTRILPSTLINTFSNDLPLYLLAGKFGIAAVGSYGMARNLLNISYNLIGHALAPVYFKEANDLYVEDKEKLQKLTLSIFFKLLIISCLGFGFIFGFGDLVFSVFLGDQWLTAGKIAAILSIYYVFKIISSPFSNLFNVAKKEGQQLIVQVVIATCRVASLYIGIATSHLLLAIIIYTFANVMGYIYTLITIMNLIGIAIVPLLLKSGAIILGIFTFFTCIRYLLSLWLPIFEFNLSIL